MSLRDNSGSVTFSDFKNVFARYLGPDSVPFDFDCDWLKLYLGKRVAKSIDNDHVLNYHEFTQMMKGLQGERIRQAFHHFDKDNDGWIRPDDFQVCIL